MDPDSHKKPIIIYSNEEFISESEESSDFE